MDDIRLSNEELDRIADFYVTADVDRTWPEVDDDVKKLLDRGDMVAIYDAEADLACIVPRENAKLMERLLNTYTPKARS